MRSYRERGKVKQEVIHLGRYSTVAEALDGWESEIKDYEHIGRPKQAQKLQRKLDRLRELSGEES